jgi:hypothetical protein
MEQLTAPALLDYAMGLPGIFIALFSDPCLSSRKKNICLIAFQFMID